MSWVQHTYDYPVEPPSLTKCACRHAATDYQVKSRRKNHDALCSVAGACQRSQQGTCQQESRCGASTYSTLPAAIRWQDWLSCSLLPSETCKDSSEQDSHYRCSFEVDQQASL